MAFVLRGNGWVLEGVGAVDTGARAEVLLPGECTVVVTTDPFTGVTSTKRVCAYPTPPPGGGCGCKKKKGCGCGRRRPTGEQPGHDLPHGGWE